MAGANGSSQRFERSAAVPRFERYEIIRELGRGGMGVVFLAHDRNLGRNVALKIIKISSELDEEEIAEFRRRFDIEAKATAALRHPNIVTLFDQSEAGGIPYMALEFVVGETLETVRRTRGKMPFSVALPPLRQAANALDYAHSEKDHPSRYQAIEHYGGSR